MKRESDRAAVIELLRLAADAPVAPPVAAVTEVVVPAEEIIIEEPASDPTEVPSEQ